MILILQCSLMGNLQQKFIMHILEIRKPKIRVQQSNYLKRTCSLKMIASLCPQMTEEVKWEYRLSQFIKTLIQFMMGSSLCPDHIFVSYLFVPSLRVLNSTYELQRSMNLLVIAFCYWLPICHSFLTEKCIFFSILTASKYLRVPLTTQRSKVKCLI